MDPLMQLSPQSLAGLMQQLQMKQLTQQQQQAANNPQQQQQATVSPQMLGLWGGMLG